MIIIAISGDPSALYGQLAGLGSTGVFILMALVSLAVIIWFARKGVPSSENTWKVFIAPALASVALAAVVILTVMHFELVVGGKPGQNLWLLFMLAGTLLAGIAVAALLQGHAPEEVPRSGTSRQGRERCRRRPRRGSSGIASRKLAADDPRACGGRRVVPLRWTDTGVRSDE